MKKIISLFFCLSFCVFMYSADKEEQSAVPRQVSVITSKLRRMMTANTIRGVQEDQRDLALERAQADREAKQKEAAQARQKQFEAELQMELDTGDGVRAAEAPLN
ncbi:hypothetical protein HN446_00555 [bacterium]|jgi:hypothetical protein|nr:hypothetical protein [bacterium]